MKTGNSDMLFLLKTFLVSPVLQNDCCLSNDDYAVLVLEFMKLGNCDTLRLLKTFFISCVLQNYSCLFSDDALYILLSNQPCNTENDGFCRRQTRNQG